MGLGILGELGGGATPVYSKDRLGCLSYLLGVKKAVFSMPLSVWSLKWSKVGSFAVPCRYELKNI